MTRTHTHLIVDAQRFCKRGGLHLHKFNSNRQEVLSCVVPSERQLGRVVETIQGSDDLVRKAKVQVGGRKLQGKHLVIERPIQKLVLLLENK